MAICKNLLLRSLDHDVLKFLALEIPNHVKVGDCRM